MFQPDCVQPELMPKLRRGLFQTGGILGLLALWFGLFATASSPSLHHWLHPEADQNNHSCVVTLLTKGGFLVGSGVGIALLVAAPCFLLILPCRCLPTSTLVFRYHSRGPPSWSSPDLVVG